jgi:hypothetical protein
MEISKDLGYMTLEEYEVISKRYDVLGKRISTLIQKWK